MDRPKISIAICTHNRPAHLAECLAGLMPQIEQGVEVLVCDSASTGDHAGAVGELVANHPSITFMRLERQGLALARNALLARAEGEWFAMIDDDAIPRPDWVDVALALTKRIGGEVGIVGGAVHPMPSTRSPADVAALRSRGQRWKQLCSVVEIEGEFDETDRPHVVAANAWFRSEPLRRIGGFPESLGRSGTSLLSGEEKLPLHMLVRQGWRVLHCGDLRVDHLVHPERMTVGWIHRRAYWDGITDRRIADITAARFGFLHSASIALRALLLSPLSLIRSTKYEFSLRLFYNLGWTRETLQSSRGSATQAGTGGL